MKNRNTKKAKTKDEAIARASEEAPITHRGHYGSNDHLYYSNSGTDIWHLSPRARKMLGVPAHRLFTG